MVTPPPSLRRSEEVKRDHDRIGNEWVVLAVGICRATGKVNQYCKRVNKRTRRRIEAEQEYIWRLNRRSEDHTESRFFRDG